jgi:pimeloyl-ACP methyl ester carboxylesterase
VAETDVQGYGAPYKYLPTKAGSSFPRFAHLALGMPDFFLRRLRETTPWKIFEAISGPSRFTGLNMLALLSERDEKMRCYWQMKQLGDKNVDRVLKTIVLFGERDPLLKDYKEMLLRVIGRNTMVDWAPNGIWLQNAGHYPIKDKPDEVAGLISRFA